MLETARFDAARRRKSEIAISIALSLYAAMFLAIGPGIVSDVDISKLVEAYPQALQDAFGLHAMGSFEGLLAAELYQFGWVILLGVYFAYTGGKIIAREVESGEMDMLLSNPVTRTGVVLEKFGAVLEPVIVLNLFVGAVVFTGSKVVSEPISLENLVMVHALSVPFFLSAAALGVLFSTVFSRESLAKRASAGLFFGLFMVETLVSGTDYSVLGRFSPSNYYNPTEILVDGVYSPENAAILSAATAVLLLLSVAVFRHRSLEN